MRILAALFLAASGALIYGVQLPFVGYPALIAAVITGFVASRALGRDLVLIALGMVIMSVVPITTDISIDHMVVMGSAMIAAIVLPYVGSRYVYRDHAVRFPVLTGHRWSKFEWSWLVAVLVLGYLLLPFYMISTGVYTNWPAASEPNEVGRLFLGTNALGIWDELFFICTVFTLLRRHYADWVAMLVQAVIFTSFLYELGFTSWGPALIFPFALVQAYTFKLTRSLSYIVAVHLLFDFILFLVLLHAHDRSIVPIFVY